MKRFYKQTGVGTAEGGWQILLDGRPMRTPAKAILIVPTQALADAIAAEWQAVPDKAEIKVAHLPLTRLAATALDRVTSQRAQVIEDIAKYSESDLVCYRASDPESLVKRQEQVWQPLLDWVAQRYDARLMVGHGTAFVSQPPSALSALHDAVTGHGDVALSALYNLTHIAGSLVIALAVAEGRLSAEEAYAAAQLDELFQIERWGEDPLATQRLAGIRGDIAACARFLALLEDKRLGGR